MLRSVDLPQPDGPISATIERGLIFRLTSATAGVRFAPAPNVLPMLCSSIISPLASLDLDRRPATRRHQSPLPESLQPTSVDVERNAGDVACPFRAQKGNRACKLFWLTEAPERVFLRGQTTRFFLVFAAKLSLQAIGMLPPQRGRPPPRTRGVHHHIVRPELGGKRFRHVEQRAVGNGRSEHVRIRLLARPADHADDAAPFLLPHDRLFGLVLSLVFVLLGVVL